MILRLHRPFAPACANTAVQVGVKISSGVCTSMSSEIKPKTGSFPEDIFHDAMVSDLQRVYEKRAAVLIYTSSFNQSNPVLSGNRNAFF